MATRKQLEEAIKATTEGSVRRAFIAAITELRDGVQIGRIIEALEAGDITGAVEAFNIDPQAFRVLERSIENALEDGGDFYAKVIQAQAQAAGLATVIRFGIRNLAAEEWLRDRSSRLVTNIVEDQREAIRETLTEGLSEGLNPRTVALDVAGRMQGNKRVGGIVGLTQQQAGWVRNMAAKLRDPARMQEYAESTMANKTYVKLINKAAKEGRALTVAERRQILSRYSAKLLKLRGDTIARTETLTAMAAAKHEATRQAMDKLGLPDDAVTRTWDSAGDARVRTTHVELDEQTIKGMDAPFVSALGSQLMFPGDISMNAAPEDTIQCRCVVRYRLAFERATR